LAALPLQVTGTLRRRSGSPVSRMVHVLSVDDQGGVGVRFSGGAVENPGAKADAKGVFRIEVPRHWVAESKKFTVGFASQTSFGRLTKDGDTVVFTVDKRTGTVDVGTVTVED
jgi:hypothetical protein